MTELLLLVYVLETEPLGKPFPIRIQSSRLVGELHEVIKEKKQLKITADLLNLYQVDLPSGDGIDARARTRLEELKRDNKKFLDPARELSDYFNEALLREKARVHVLVVLPAELSQKEAPPPESVRRSSLPPLSKFVVQRSETVKALYEKLLHYHFIQVRGTPASGKTTLALLLWKYISIVSPETKLVWIGSWTEERLKGTNCHSFLSAQKDWQGLEKETNPTILVFDEAQTSYWDAELWNEIFKNFYKRSNEVFRHHAIIFTSYGGPTKAAKGTPGSIPLAQQVSLNRTKHSDGLDPVGLLYTTEEFDALINLTTTCNPGMTFQDDLKFEIFRLTGGHPGAIEGVIKAIQRSNRGHTNILNRLPCTLEILNDDLLKNMRDPRLFDFLSTATTFTRGLPADSDLQDIKIARLLSTIASQGSITQDELDGRGPEWERPFQTCLVNGWIHSDLDGKVITYAFASLLHQWYVVHRLNGSSPPVPKDINLFNCVKDVIRRFSPHSLSAPRMGPGFKIRPPEAQYQDEFYRCWYDCGRGLLPPAISEKSGQHGRVDFYIPKVDWGIELLCEGNEVEEHYSRFAPGGKYEDLQAKDFIVLDFHTTKPVKQFPGSGNLYHIVLRNDFKEVSILNNMLESVDEFRILSSDLPRSAV